VLGVEPLGGHPFYVILLGEDDDDLVFVDEVATVEVATAVALDDPGATLVVVALTHCFEFLDDDRSEFGLVPEDGLQAVDTLGDVLVVRADLRRLHRGERAQLHPDDVVGLVLAEPELAGEPRTGGVAVLGVTDGVDDRLGVVEHRQSAFEDVCSVPGLVEFVLGASTDDLGAVGDVLL
jgi:hypothetical protein